MSRSRMFGDDEPESADNASPRRTIVGGRPPEKTGAPPPVPTGIQRLLRMAALDPSFLEQLVRRRGEVAPHAGVELSATEVAILRAIPAEQLTAMAERMPPVEAPRREFLRQSAATAVVLLGGAALAACEACTSPPIITRGATADMPPAPLPPPPTPPPTSPQFAEPPPPRPDVNDMQSEGGAAPHEPPPRPDEPLPNAGVRPDIPPEPQPPPPYVSPPGGARPDMPPEPTEPRPETTSPTRGIRIDMPQKK